MEYKMAFLQKRVIVPKGCLVLYKYPNSTRLIYWWHENDL